MYHIVENIGGRNIAEFGDNCQSFLSQSIRDLKDFDKLLFLWSWCLIPQCLLFQRERYKVKINTCYHQQVH